MIHLFNVIICGMTLMCISSHNLITIILKNVKQHLELHQQVISLQIFFIESKKSLASFSHEVGSP